MRTYAVRIVIYFAAGVCRGKSIFLIIAPKHRLWVLRGGSSVYPQSMSKNKKNVNFSAEILIFLKLKKSLFIAWACFHNDD